MSGTRNFRRMLCGCAAVAIAALAGTPGHADPGDALDTGGSGIAQHYVDHADDELEHGRITHALALVDRAIALYPHYMGAKGMRGQILMQAGLYDTAVSDLTDAIAAYPEYSDYYYIRGETYLRQHKPKDAIKDFTLALTAPTGIYSVDAALIYLNRSLAFRMMGLDAASLVDFQSAAKMLYGDEYGWIALADACYTAAVTNYGDTATMLCDEAIERHSRIPSVSISRGLTLLKAQDWSGAIAAYSKTLYYQDDSTFALYGRGIARRASGDSAGAAADMAAARSGEPTIADIMSRLGIPPDFGAPKPTKKTG